MKYFITGAILASTITACNRNNEENQNNVKPNIIIFYADDLGYGDVSSYGSDIPTPNIDRIGEEGIRFTDFYVSAPGCTPSRYSLLTGAYPQRSHHGLSTVSVNSYHEEFDSVETLIPAYLKPLGYKTAVVGKWHLGGSPLEHGFDKFIGFSQGSIDYYTRGAEFYSHFYNASPEIKYLPYNLDWFHGTKRKKEEGYTTDLIGKYAMKYVDEFHSGNHPFFIYVAFNAPHYGKSKWNLAPPENTITLAGEDPKHFTKKFHSLQAPINHLEKFEHVEDIYRRYYSAMVASMDDNVGKVWNFLDSLDILDNTIIWFISDNGGYATKYHGHASNGALRGQKGELYEGGIRIPSLMCWKNQIEGNLVISTPCINTDVLPTLAKFIGFSDKLVNRTIDGKDISGVIQQQEELYRPIFWHYDQSGDHALRIGKWKMKEDELYNLEEDISERHDLSKNMPDKYKEIRSIYDSLEVNMTLYNKQK